LARTGSTICPPVVDDAYRDLVDDPRRFRDWLDAAFRDGPELFPRAFAGGYRLKDARTSAKAGVRLRRVRGKSGGSQELERRFLIRRLALLKNPISG
jgi:hypothetical protein